MHNKKVVFYLLLMVVVSGLLTFGLYHYKKQQSPLNNIESYSWGQGKILISKDALLSELLKKYSSCTIHRGIPLEVDQEAPGVFVVKRLSGLPEHQGLDINIGDRLLNAGFILKSSESKGILQRITETGAVEKISYEPAQIFYCLP